MPFTNELISEADVIKYGIRAINRKFMATKRRELGDCHWTVDRQRDVYLRCVANGRDESRRHSTWTLYWKGDLLTVQLVLLEAGGASGAPGWSHWRLQGLAMPAALEAQRSQILADLIEALAAYRDAGVYSTSTQHVMTLEIG